MNQRQAIAAATIGGGILLALSVIRENRRLAKFQEELRDSMVHLEHVEESSDALIADLDKRIENAKFWLIVTQDD